MLQHAALLLLPASLVSPGSPLHHLHQAVTIVARREAICACKQTTAIGIHCVDTGDYNILGPEDGSDTAADVEVSGNASAAKALPIEAVSAYPKAERVESKSANFLIQELAPPKAGALPNPCNHQPHPLHLPCCPCAVYLSTRYLGACAALLVGKGGARLALRLLINTLIPTLPHPQPQP